MYTVRLKPDKRARWRSDPSFVGRPDSAEAETTHWETTERETVAAGQCGGRDNSVRERQWLDSAETETTQ